MHSSIQLNVVTCHESPPPTSSTQAANGEVRHHAGHACITHTRSPEKPQAHPGRGPTDDAYRKRTVALSEAKAVRVRVTVRVCAVSQRELFTFTTQSPLAAVVFGCGSDACKALTVIKSGLHYAVLM